MSLVTRSARRNTKEAPKVSSVFFSFRFVGSGEQCCNWLSCRANGMVNSGRFPKEQLCKLVRLNPDDYEVLTPYQERERPHCQRLWVSHAIKQSMRIWTFCGTVLPWSLSLLQQASWAACPYLILRHTTWASSQWRLSPMDSGIRARFITLPSKF